MANNRTPQLIQEIFPLQANGAAAVRKLTEVVQDKARTKSARPATPRPAAVANGLRAKQKNKKNPQTHTRSPVHHNKVQLTLWVHPIVKEALQRIAKREGLSLSKSGAAFLKRSLQQNIDLAYSALLTPIIEAAIDRRMRARDARLSWLIARNIFASEQTRAVAANILGRQQGMTEETLKTILVMTKRTAQSMLTRRNPELEELMAAVKQWVDRAEQEPSH